MSVSVKAWNSKFRYSPAGGTYQQTYIVDGLDPSNPDNCALATTAIDTATGIRIPAYQQPHATIAGLYCVGFDCQHLGTEQSPNRSAVAVTVLFGSPEFVPNSTIIEVFSLNGTSTASRWPFGELAGQPIYVAAAADSGTGMLVNVEGFPDRISTAYVKNALAKGIPNPLSGGGKYDILFDIAKVPVLSGGIGLRFTRRENTAPRIARYIRKISSNAWQGLPKGLWICRSVNARNIIGVGSIFPGGGFEVVYEFQTSPDLDPSLPVALNGFTRAELFVDYHSGRQVVGADVLDGTNNGYTLADMYAPVNFDELNLPVVWESLY